MEMSSLLSINTLQRTWLSSYSRTVVRASSSVEWSSSGPVATYPVLTSLSLCLSYVVTRGYVRAHHSRPQDGEYQAWRYNVYKYIVRTSDYSPQPSMCWYLIDQTRSLQILWSVLSLAQSWLHWLCNLNWKSWLTSQLSSHLLSSPLSLLSITGPLLPRPLNGGCGGGGLWVLHWILY